MAPPSSPADIDHVVVVGYDHWTEAVLDTLDDLGIDTALIVPGETTAAVVDAHDRRLVRTETLNEAAFRDAGAQYADAVLVATFDGRLNVLAVLTASEVVEDATIATFADERRDTAKLKRAGADTVVNLGPVVAELLVDTALTGDDPRALLDVLLADESVVDSRALDQEPAPAGEQTAEPDPLETIEDEAVPTTTSELASESIDVAAADSDSSAPPATDDTDDANTGGDDTSADDEQSA
jgi:Trk K+ transport system NAD-binding subunit